MKLTCIACLETLLEGYIDKYFSDFKRIPVKSPYIGAEWHMIGEEESNVFPMADSRAPALISSVLKRSNNTNADQPENLPLWVYRTEHDMIGLVPGVRSCQTSNTKQFDFTILFSQQCTRWPYLTTKEANVHELGFHRSWAITMRYTGPCAGSVSEPH